MLQFAILSHVSLISVLVRDPTQ